MKWLSYIFIMRRGRGGDGCFGDSLRASGKLINLSGLWPTMEKPQLRPVSGKKTQTELAKQKKLAKRYKCICSMYLQHVCVCAWH